MDYLMWGVAWINVRLMVEDAVRIIHIAKENGTPDDEEKVDVKLEGKEDIKKFINSLM